MKQRVVPTQREIPFSSEELIVSKTDLKGRITYANPAMCRHLGYTREEILRQAFGPRELGKVIGRGGRTAKAIRTVVRAAASRQNLAARIDFED